MAKQKDHYMGKFLAIFLLLATTACSVSEKKLSDDAKKIKVISRANKKCHVIGKYVGNNEDGTVELARNHALNLAAKDDANSIIFTEEVNNGKDWKVYATGYHCP